MWTIDAPESRARRTSFAYSSGVYGIPSHCALLATAPETAQVMMHASWTVTFASLGPWDYAEVRCSRESGASLRADPAHRGRVRQRRHLLRASPGGPRGPSRHRLGLRRRGPAGDAVRRLRRGAPEGDGPGEPVLVPVRDEQSERAADRGELAHRLPGRPVRAR